MRRIYTTKIASTLEPPPAMVDQVFDIVDEHIEKAIEQQNYQDLDTQISIDTSGWKYAVFHGKDIKVLVNNKILDKTEENIENLRRKAKEGSISFTEEDINETRDMMIEKRLGKASNINIKTEQNGEKYGKKGAEWDNKAMTIVVFLPEDLEEVDYKDVRKNIIHELRHFTQTYLSLAISGLATRLTGIPPNTTPDFQQNSKDPEYKIHSMDDYEFYPKLGDAIQESIPIIRQYYSKPEAKTPINQMIEMIIENNSFFQDLKRYPEAEGKLQKAKSEFYKAMKDVFNDIKKQKNQ